MSKNTKNELTAPEKWKPVDQILERIERNRKANGKPYEYPIDEYIDYHFGNKPNPKR
jgi:hypothetical protein